ncbi:phosphohistidine phosphatase, SixA [Rhodopirellula maiorica SM1]|uniref:Phosphohistidine phosphatase, SixA n=1 Tax=Rhodopirellula maiorica SM1 TaxID=1265738 RepID=M5RMN6_9BACT|nr:histidine phosphatase family protein [Rhodopirellula maiorica]EMI20588.1 phosphohistidine phosphatase, SixA [Rhodopirellula maiorica SM1]
MDDPSAAALGKRHRLILMRHAKSDWSDGGLSDHDRPLNKRGKRDAPQMAEWLREIDCLPNVVLCSSAVRTRETLERMQSSFGSDVVVSYSESLYLASPETISNVIASDHCDASTVMVLAHNPGMAYLVSQLAGQMVDMPTAAIAYF